MKGKCWKEIQNQLCPPDSGQGQREKEVPVMQRIHDLQKKASLQILWEYFLLRLFRFLLQWTILNVVEENKSGIGYC